MSKMVTPALRLLVFLLVAHHVSFAFNFDQIIDFTGVFEKCASNETLNTSTPCVCMNTVPAERSDKDRRYKVIAHSCLNCRAKASCSAASCRKLATCSSSRGCKRFCFCLCSNRTKNYGGRVYIPCDDWCASRIFCPAARAACTSTSYSFKLSTTGIAILVTIIAVCFVSRIFQKLRRKRIATRSANQQSEGAVTASPRASVETLRLPNLFPDPQQSISSPSAQPTDAPAYSTLPAPGRCGANPTGDAALTAQSEAPPDYDTVMSQNSIYRTPPPKYS